MTSCKIHHSPANYLRSVPRLRIINYIVSGKYVGSVGSPNNLPIRDYNAFKLMRNIAPIDPSLPSDSRSLDYCISIREGGKLTMPARVASPPSIAFRAILDDPCKPR